MRRRRRQEAFAEAYRLDPNKVEAIVSYARILRQRGQMAEAADMFARAYARSPRFPARRRGIRHGARSSRATRRGEEALPRRERPRTARWSGLSRAGSSPARRSRRATRNEAIRWVKRALVEVPGEPELTKMLGELERAGRAGE